MKTLDDYLAYLICVLCCIMLYLLVLICYE